MQHLSSPPNREEISYNPHHYLGIHEIADGQKVIRLYRPGAVDVYLELFNEVVKTNPIPGEEGFFELKVPSHTTPMDYRVFHQNGLLAHDPYAFLPTVGEIDTHLFARGVHYEIYEILGAHLVEHHGVKGCKFAVWAPNALSVALIADFNFFDGRINPMRNLGSSGIWELFVPGINAFEKYKFEIRSHDGRLRVKADPYANAAELRPKTASVVVDADRFQWSDQNWIKERESWSDKNKPMLIYELHLGSWMKQDGKFLNYRDLAHHLVDYVQKLHFTHVELMPIAEHPLDESWGYQVTGFYAVTSRFGTPEDFQYFVNHLHQHKIGVILDWVPAHFPTDDFALAQFDGSYLYEHADPKQGFHPHWNTYIFNYGRNEVANFLIGSALYFIEKMHIDGFRVDAVASMIYLNYGRSENEWIPNIYGGKENLEAIEFLKHFNSIVHSRYPGFLTIAEESTAFTGVTHPLEWGGLGFDFKWNMGWMNDTLGYISKDPFYRHYHHNELTFSMCYAFSERFVLPLSHDEIVHGKRSLLSKMPGDQWQQFANMRLLYSYLVCHPGKKLLFMGGELGQYDEWNCREELQWHLLTFPYHSGLQRFIGEMNRFYMENKPLWRFDFSFDGFEWLNCHDKISSVLSYMRKGENGYLVCVHNFTPTYHPTYYIPLMTVKNIKEVFNSDREEFGGSGKIGAPIRIAHNEKGENKGFDISLAPLATMIFEVQF